jgi:HK97 family phage portal protein
VTIWFKRPATTERSLSWPVTPNYLAAGGQGFNDVDLSSAETAMQAIAVRSAVDLIASLASELPKDVYSGEGSERRKRTMPGYLLDPAGDGYGLADWCYQAVESWLWRGNLYGDELDRAAAGYPTQVQLFHPDVVRGRLEGGRVVWTVNGQELERGRRIRHYRVNPIPGQVVGLSPIAAHASSIGLALTATRFGLQWFQDGAHPSGMLTNTEVPLDKGQADTAKERFLAALRGTREPVVMGKGWKYDRIQVSPEESQFLQTQGYTAAECARIYGPGIAEILGYESGGSLTYSNVESRSAHLLVYSLNKWLTRLERVLTDMLPRPQYVRINRDALLQSTTLERFRAHESALRNGWKVPNEVRELEDMQPLDGGDKPITSGAPEKEPADEPSGAETPPPKGN